MGAPVSSELPDYFFRVRENGAFVFRLDGENRQRRIEMEQIAAVNINNGQVKPHGDRPLTPEDEAAIKDWMDKRREILARRDMEDIHRAVDYLNLTAHWAQTRATDEQLEEVTTPLLLAMHDLRSVLVRKKADRTLKGK